MSEETTEAWRPSFLTFKEKALTNPAVREAYLAAKSVQAITEDLLTTDALTGNSEGTPDAYTVHADDLEYLVRTVLEVALAHVSEADR